MEERTYLLNMFSDYEPPEPLYEALSQAVIVTADMDLMSRKIRVIIRNESYIPQKDLMQVATDIAKLYDLNSLDLRGTYPADQLQKIPAEDLMDMFI